MRLVTLLFAASATAVLVALPAVAAKPKKKGPRKADSGHYVPHNIEPLHSVSDFQDKVEHMVNNSDYAIVGGSAEYSPVVFFHVSWCEHCRAAMPILDDVAGELLDQSQKGGFMTPPKFFSLQCDKVPKEVTLLCDKFVGTKFPSMYVFREQRAFRFLDRPRTKPVFKWWISRMIRPYLVAFQTFEDAWSSQEPVFIMRARDDEKAKLDLWLEFAAKYMDMYTFAVAAPDGDMAKDMEQDLSMWAPPPLGLSPLPFSGDLDEESPEILRQSVQDWMNVNRFPAIGHLNDPRTVHGYESSNMKVIVLVHDRGKTSSQTRKEFSALAKRLRPAGKYLFAMANASSENGKEVLQHKFPLLAPGACRYPRIFGLLGRDYFEDPAFTTLKDFNEGIIEALFANEEARQGTSWADWFKARRKLYTRFASESIVNLVLAVAMPILLVVILYLLGKLFFDSLGEDDEDPKAVENKKGK